jgi:hypothetical protein
LEGEKDMINDMWRTIQEDIEVLTYCANGKKIPNVKDGDQNHRVRIAAIRMIAAIATAFLGLWTLSILSVIVTFPLKILFNLALAVSCCVLAHDIFVLSRNNANPSQNSWFNFFNYFKGNAAVNEERARQYTRGTILRPVWVWLYLYRNAIAS